MYTFGCFVQQEIITAFKRKISSEKYRQQATTERYYVRANRLEAGRKVCAVLQSVRDS
mgnify:CR=1 FL=1